MSHTQTPLPRRSYHIPHDIFQEVASYLYKADVDNLRLIHRDTAHIFYPHHRVLYVGKCDRNLPAYYRYVTYVICATHLAKGNSIRILDISRLFHLNIKGINSMPLIEVLGIANERPEKYDGLSLPNLKGIACITAHRPCLKFMRRAVTSIMETHPKVKSLYCDNNTLIRSVPHSIDVIHSKCAVDDTSGTLRVLSIDFDDGDATSETVETFMSNCSETFTIASRFPRVTTVIVPRDPIHVIYIPQGVTRLVCSRLIMPKDTEETCARLSSIDIVQTGGRKRSSHRREWYDPFTHGTIEDIIRR